MIIRLTCVFAIIRSLAFAALPSPEIAPSPILSVMERVADWQLAHPSDWKPIQWHSAAFYTGLMALTDISGSPRFYESMSSIAESSEWKVGPRKYDADDYCVGQAYTELFFRQRDQRAL